MEYPMQIEYVRGSENALSDALSRLDSVAIDSKVPNDLAKGVPSYVCIIADVDRLDARTDWSAQKHADPTISRVIQLLNQKASPDSDELDGDPTLKSYSDVWAQLVLKETILKHVNERAISTRIVVPAALREEVFRALHEPAHHGYEATLRRISQRFWWPRVRSEVSTLLKAFETCDRNRNSNPSPRAPLGHLPADQPF